MLVSDLHQGKVVNLTLKVRSGMQVYPGGFAPEVETYSTSGKDGYNSSSIKIWSHTGTHVDAPYHFFVEGKRVDEIDIRTYVSRALIVDLTGKGFRDPIHPQDLQLLVKLGTRKAVNSLIIKTGFGKYVGTEHYVKDFPYITEDTAKAISTSGIKLVGIDTISIEKPLDGPWDGRPVHRALLTNGLVILEGLSNLESIEREPFWLIVAPLFIEGIDGSPATVYAVF